MEENPPSQGSRRAVDLTVLDTFIEVKRRLGNVGGFNPNPEYVRQLDDYLAESQRAGKGVRMGVLTDGKYWLWHDLPCTAVGEIAHDTEQMDDLFVRHTYLAAVISARRLHPMSHWNHYKRYCR